MTPKLTANISSKAAAKLLISHEISISPNWPTSISTSILESLAALSFEELLSIIDYAPEIAIMTKYIPQVSDKTLKAVIPLLFKTKYEVNFAQLGNLMNDNPNASLGANERYGHFYATCLEQMGITVINDGKVMLSSLGYSLALISNSPEYNIIIDKLYLRIPFIQDVLRKAKSNKYNCFLSMTNLEKSTQDRRRSSIVSLLKALTAYNDVALNSRIQNIYWEESNNE